MVALAQGKRHDMPMHLIGYETSASQASPIAITPIPDQVVQIQGTTVLVPQGVPNICYAAAMINSAVATLRVQLSSPSLLAVVPFDVSPIANGLVFGTLPRVVRMGMAPLPLVPAEPLSALVQNGAAVMNRAFVWLCDGPVKPVTAKAYSVRFTASATLVTASWVNSAITFATSLPAGNYQVVGMRLWSANSCAARLFFKGSFFRPGVPTANAEDNNEWPDFRMGTYGVWDQFNNITPPSVDIMGITDSAEQGFLDLIKVS
jgi:hypothetical protein